MLANTVATNVKRQSPTLAWCRTLTESFMPGPISGEITVQEVFPYGEVTVTVPGDPPLQVKGQVTHVDVKWVTAPDELAESTVVFG
jgi:hypothetical protein